MRHSPFATALPAAGACGCHFDTDDEDFGSAVARVAEALKTEGLGVQTEIEVQATMKATLGVEGRPYCILGACNPPLAHRALDAEPDIGLLVPYNGVVREDSDGRLVVGFMDPVAVSQMTGDAEMAQVDHEVNKRVQRVKALLPAPSTTSPRG